MTAALVLKSLLTPGLSFEYETTDESKEPLSLGYVIGGCMAVQPQVFIRALDVHSNEIMKNITLLIAGAHLRAQTIHFLSHHWLQLFIRNSEPTC